MNPQTNTTIPDVLLTEREAAAAVRLSAKTLRNHRALKKGLPFVRVGRAVRYRRADLLAYVRSLNEAA